MTESKTTTARAGTYQPQSIEKHWQNIWQEQKAFRCDDAQQSHLPTYYVLEMFPYPSGHLHMGHVRNYTIGDAFARYKRMCGFHVLHPMGWDALGLPAENQAIQEKIAPQIRTPKNISQMRQQLQLLGLSYDWQREIATYLPSYYRWNQWFFLKMWQKGLVYKRQATVNFCPGCNTVLANEQILADNTCWRGHPGVENRSIPEWAFKITHYAQELLDDLDTLSQWPERIVSQQRHWLGKSVGTQVTFALKDDPQQSIAIFTTRLDTIYGCNFLVLAPEHPLATRITTADRLAEVTAFIEEVKQSDTISRTAIGQEKYGIFTGAYAIHPLSRQEIPIWLANFVLAEYGTGAVMAVPAHDSRDHAFALKYQLPIRAVIQTTASKAASADTSLPFTEDGILEQSGPYNGLTSEQARQKICEDGIQQGFAKTLETWHLRDWGFARQRYWGTPIPIIYCPEHGAVAVAEDQLPVVLPDFDSSLLSGTDGAPLAKVESFVNCLCPICGKASQRETETMDTFVDSSWYFARYLSPHDDTQAFSRQLAEKWLPVDLYIGGPEHAVMHLLYFRFFCKVMRDLGLLNISEPAKRLLTQGMVNSPSFRCPQHGYLSATTMQALPEAQRLCPTCQKPLQTTVEKMSKSKLNGIDPLDLLEKYGADATRLYTLFAAPPDKDLEWNQQGVEGVYRFLSRFYRLYTAYQSYHKIAWQMTDNQAISYQLVQSQLDEASQKLRHKLHQTLQQTREEIDERGHFNTVIAFLMELCNELYEQKIHEASCSLPKEVIHEALLRMTQLLSPFAPHLAEEIWQGLGGKGFVGHSAFPQADVSCLEVRSVTIAIQINGKLRGQITTDKDITEDALLKQIITLRQTEEHLNKHFETIHIKKQIYIKNKLINFVGQPLS